MARQIINPGTQANNGKDGDTNRDATLKINANFAELYAGNSQYVTGPGQVQGGAMVIFSGTTGNAIGAHPSGAPGTAAFRNATDFASAAQGRLAENAQAKLSAGNNITIDSTDPLNPIISATGGTQNAVQTVAGIAPVGGDVQGAQLATALGVDTKLDKTGTATAATKLATPRKINGVDFDGTASITVADSTKEPVIAGGTAAQYWNGLKQFVPFNASVLAAALAGLDTANPAKITATDTVLSAAGKLQAQINALPTPEAGGGMPVGSIVPWGFARGVMPAGWIARDGQLLNRADWPDLWSLVQPGAVSDAAWLAAPYTQRGRFSDGNGTTTFRMPDTNGKHADGNTIAAMVLRGDGKNSAGTYGLHQADQVQGMRNTTANLQNTTATRSPSLDAEFLAPLTRSYTSLLTGSSWSAGYPATTGIPVSDGANGTPRVGSETRGANETVIWCTVGAGKAVNPGSVDVVQLATTVSNIQTQIQSLDALSGFALLYPNGTPAAPGTFAINTRMVIDNPFQGSPVIVVAEVLFNGVWADPGFVFVSGASGYGVKASQIYGTGQIAVQSGGVQLVIASAQGGGGHGSTANGSGPLPCRVKVWRVKG